MPRQHWTRHWTLLTYWMMILSMRVVHPTSWLIAVRPMRQARPSMHVIHTRQLIIALLPLPLRFRLVAMSHQIPMFPHFSPDPPPPYGKLPSQNLLVVVAILLVMVVLHRLVVVAFHLIAVALPANPMM